MCHLNSLGLAQYIPPGSVQTNRFARCNIVSCNQHEIDRRSVIPTTNAEHCKAVLSRQECARATSVAKHHGSAPPTALRPRAYVGGGPWRRNGPAWERADFWKGSIVVLRQDKIVSILSIVVLACHMPRLTPPRCYRTCGKRGRAGIDGHSEFRMSSGRSGIRLPTHGTCAPTG